MELQSSSHGLNGVIFWQVFPPIQKGGLQKHITHLFAYVIKITRTGAVLAGGLLVLTAL